MGTDKEKTSITLNLGVADRIVIQRLRPQEGGLIEQRTWNIILEKVMFSMNEIEEWEIKDKKIGENKSITTWSEKAPEVEIVFTPGMVVAITNRLEKIIEDKKITPELVRLCDLFEVEE